MKRKIEIVTFIIIINDDEEEDGLLINVLGPPGS